MGKGMVFNIQKYCVHDGPGIRSIVFFKGCPLKCKWCSNPEGMAAYPEITYKSKKCITVEKCGFCIKQCPTQAIEIVGDLAHIDRKKCQRCGRCTQVCPAKAMEQMGRMMTVQEVIDKIEEDGVFYSRSGGGMTLSGGEPLLQPKFAVALLEEARKYGLETAIETTGCVPWETAKPAFEALNFIYYDLKCYDDDKHQAYTGQSNQLILDNLKKLCEIFPNKPMVVRTPVIPGFNDKVEDLQKMVDYVNKVAKNMPNIKYELLPFHNFGSSKYEFQGKPYELADLKNMDKEFVADLRQKIKSNIEII